MRLARIQFSAWTNHVLDVFSKARRYPRSIPSMWLDLTPEQQFLRETTAKFLADQVPAAVLQRFGGTVPADFEAAFWRKGATLGWTSLLVSDSSGGGGISEQPLVDLTLIASEFGRYAAPGPLLPANVVAAALSETGSHPEVLAELMAGTAVAAWCLTEPREGRLPGHFPAVCLTITPDAGQLVLNGVKRPVEAAGAASHLLVTGVDPGGGLTQVLVPAAAQGVSVSPLASSDYSRRFAAVTFTDVRLPGSAVVGERGGAAGQVERQLQIAVVLACAEATGAMQAGFDMTLAWARERYSFGRPLAAYQALKHRFADMKTWLEASLAITATAATAVGEGTVGKGTVGRGRVGEGTVGGRAAEAGELASAAKAYIGQYGPELMQECVQLHGGIGLTKELDLHLYLRRVAVNAMLYGTPAEHRQRIANYVKRPGEA
jgi:alkylation response protein AidB-like acyl-CoA dehydrogenase